MTMRPARPSPRAAARQSGAALLMAMLTVMLVATFAASALWQQWRSAEVEAAERSRIQAAWVLVGALDWSRLILGEDGRAGGADSLAEPWAVPLEEARLTSFLSADKNVASDDVSGLPDAFLSGYMVDAQSKLNVLSLIDGNKPSPTGIATFTKLFGILGLPASELSALTSGLRNALATGTGDDGGGDASPLMPQQVSQLVWFGLSPSTVAALGPYVTILPVRTVLNVNTAPAEALAASVPLLDMAGARQLVERRTRTPFQSLADANQLIDSSKGQFVDGVHGIATSFFEVHGKLRLDRTWVQEDSLVQRNGIVVTTLWRTRGAGATLAPSS
jgi:general secretion pathway protein K